MLAIVVYLAFLLFFISLEAVTSPQNVLEP